LADRFASDDDDDDDDQNWPRRTKPVLHANAIKLNQNLKLKIFQLQVTWFLFCFRSIAHVSAA